MSDKYRWQGFAKIHSSFLVAGVLVPAVPLQRGRDRSDLRSAWQVSQDLGRVVLCLLSL